MKKRNIYRERNLRFPNKHSRTRSLILSSRFVWLVWFVVSLFFINIFYSCSRQRVSDGQIIIAVSIPPQAWFVSQIAGDKADVIVLVPAGQNPHNYEPTPRQIQALSNASAWILSGAEFEISLHPKIASLFPDLPIIDGTLGVNFRYLEDHADDYNDQSHTHDNNADILNSPLHNHHYDRHTWLGREPAKTMAVLVTFALISHDSGNVNYYYQRYIDVIEKIDTEFDELQISLAPLKGKSVFVYHPSFGYFLDEFGIIQEAVETGGKEPTARQLNSLIEKINAEKPAAIFVQTQFPVNAAKTIADTVGAQVIELDPLAEDWLENIKHMGQILQNIIQ
ncbi:MAG: zinc ABC transporter substrate-binding protein [Treponema sp.]|nr:zinc ABC transporter substrate-binding protein [Treponema sp.]